MKRLFNLLLVVAAMVSTSCGTKTDQCTEHPWQLSVRNVTAMDAFLIFYGDRAGDLDTVKTKAASTTQFLSGKSCGLYGIPIVYTGDIDSAAVVFADCKRMAFRYNNIASADSAVQAHSPLLPSSYVQEDIASVYVIDSLLYGLAR